MSFTGEWLPPVVNALICFFPALDLELLTTSFASLNAAFLTWTISADALWNFDDITPCAHFV